MMGMSHFWSDKAEELDRMVRLGFIAWRQDTDAIRAHAADPSRTALPSGPKTLAVTFFLAATAIENLLKANLVVEHPEFISKGRLRGAAIVSHDLLGLARDAGVALDPDEADFCELGSEAIRSFGRYHIGKRASTTPSRITIKEGAFLVYERLRTKLQKRVDVRPWKNYSPQPGAARNNRRS
jgi:hypothetical protein